MPLMYPVNTFVSGASLDPPLADPLSITVDIFTDSACTSPATVTDVYTGDALATLTIENNRLQYFNGPRSEERRLYIRATDSVGVGLEVDAQPLLRSLITLTQFKTRFDTTDDALAQVGLDDGSALIREATGNQYAWRSAPGGVPKAVQVILARATARWLNNPDSLQSESFGSYSYAYGKEATAGIWLTDPEVVQIRRAYGSSVPRSIRAESPYTECNPFGNTVYSNVGDPTVDSHWGGAYAFFDPDEIELVERWIYP
jgi:hypothetical protein